MTRLEAGIADNVVPDRAVATINFRYAPDRHARERRRVPALADARRARPSRSSGDNPPAAVVTDTPLVRALPRRGRSRVRAQAGVDERRRLHDPRHRRGQLRAGRDPLRAPARRARRDRVAGTGVRDAAPVRRPGSVRVGSPPSSAAQATYPFVRLNQAAAERARARARGDRLRDGRPARAHRSAHHRGAARTGCASGWATRPPSGCPSCGRRSRPGAGGDSARSLDPDRHVIPTLGSKEAIFSFAQVVLDLRRAATPWS